MNRIGERFTCNFSLEFPCSPLVGLSSGKLTIRKPEFKCFSLYFTILQNVKMLQDVSSCLIIYRQVIVNLIHSVSETN